MGHIRKQESFLLLFLHAPPEFTDLFTEFVIVPVRISDQFGSFHVELPRFGNNETFIGLNGDDIGNKHIMRA